MSDLVEFLNARLDEDEISWTMNHGDMRMRMLREVEAKRRILDIHRFGRGNDYWYNCDVTFPCATLRALAAVYSGHSDYDPEWSLSEPGR
jgi:Family of unknown function (DUF6221)